ncbi:MAG: M3 family oligoendopeptidase [Fimbriimonadaceae bacterium]|nr:M3 family oligoendopeptidase [Fimbriimonadaceae bacterium]
MTAPTTLAEAKSWTWADYQARYDALAEADLTPDTLEAWLKDWNALEDALSEVESRLYVATSVNTADEAAEQELLAFSRDIDEPRRAASQKLKEKLLASGLSLPMIEIPLKRMKMEASVYREANLPRFTQLVELSNEFGKLCGAQSVEWDGEEKPLSALNPLMESSDRGTREKAYRAKMGRILADRAGYNSLWTRMYGLRQEIAREAGFATFTDYQYRAMGRLEYGPDQVAEFRDSIEEVVVPVVARLMADRRTRLGIDPLRPWDAFAPLPGEEPLKPYAEDPEFTAKAQAIFDDMGGPFPTWFKEMTDEGLMDLFGRKHKANGGYCTTFPLQRRPFIFQNATGTHDDVQTLVHEAGHCFHAYECFDIPFGLAQSPPMEFCEVASMGMEMLAQSRMNRFYDEKGAARASLQHLEKCLLFWPYMSVVDGFQHWAYASADGADPAACDAAWLDLDSRFMPWFDWSGMEDIRVTGWHRKLHIFEVPFYYVEYGMAQIGAFQVWANAQADDRAAIEKYLAGLKLGGSADLHGLFAAVGGSFDFSRESLRRLMDQAEAEVDRLRGVIG